jgi:hypothetical protein
MCQQLCPQSHSQLYHKMTGKLTRQLTATVVQTFRLQRLRGCNRMHSAVGSCLAML